MADSQHIISRKIPKGFCQCGCGQKTNIAKSSDKRYGTIKGKPVRFINGHNACGEMSKQWKGGRIFGCRGYWLVNSRTHKRKCRSYVYEHIVVWETFHKKDVPKGHVIHHINGIKTDNRIENLVAMSSHHHDRLIPILEKRIRDLEESIEKSNKLEKAFSEPWPLGVGIGKIRGQ